MYWEIGETAAHSMSCTAPPHEGAPYSMRVAIIIRVDPDGLITRVDEYFDPGALDPLQKQEPSRR